MFPSLPARNARPGSPSLPLDPGDFADRDIATFPVVRFILTRKHATIILRAVGRSRGWDPSGRIPWPVMRVRIGGIFFAPIGLMSGRRHARPGPHLALRSPPVRRVLRIEVDRATLSVV